MIKRIILAGLTALLLGVLPAAAAPGPEAYDGTQKRIRGLKLSPEGGYVAMISNINSNDAITIAKVGGGRCNVGNGGNQLVGVYWATEQRLAVVAVRRVPYPDDVKPPGRDAWYFLGASYSMKTDCTDIKRLDGHEFMEYLPDGKLLMAVDTSYSLTNADKASRRSVESFYRTDIFKVDPTTGASEPYETGTPYTRGWILDRQNKAKIRFDIQRGGLVGLKRYLVFARLGDSSDWTRVYDGRDEKDEEDVLEFLDVGTNPDTAYVRTRANGDRYGIYEFDLRTKAITRPVYVNQSVDVAGLTYASYDNAPTGVAFEADESNYAEYFDKTFAQMAADLKVTFPGEEVGIVSVSRDRKSYVAYVEGATNPGGVFHYVANSEISEVGRQHPALTPQDIGPVKFFKYTARDGLEIPAYLTLPYGSSGKNLPLVVMPHGGPEARDTKLFGLGWEQFLASRGYAVLQPQFRGSDGFGKAFRNAGWLKWGQEMQHDITDGVRKLIADGTVDASRVCIVGWSYGGYATLAGLAFTPEMYKCGVAGAPVSDLPKMLQWLELNLNRALNDDDYWTKRIGHLRRDLDKLIAASPARNADKIVAPLMLVHGKEDQTVPVEQTHFMADAMKKAGKSSTQVILIDGDDHYLSKTKTGVDFLTNVERFLDQHLKAK